MNLLPILACLVTAAVVQAPAQVPTGQEPRGVRVEWEQVIQADDVEYDYRAAAAGRPGGGVWVLVGSRPKGRLSPPEGYVLWHVNAAGAVTLRLHTDDTLKKLGQGARFTNVFGITPLGATRLALVARVEPLGTLLVLLDSETGQFLSADRIEAGQDLFLTKVRQTADGNLLLLGHSGGDGWLAAVSASGKTVWERRLGKEGVAVVLDVAPSGGEGFVLLGSRKSSPSEDGSWVGRVSAKGELISESRVAGYAESISGSADGTSIVIGQARGANGKDIWARLLTLGLSDKQNISLLSEVKSLFPFKSVPFPGGGWLVTGSGKDHLPWFARVTKDGRLAWADARRYDPKLVPIAGRADIVANDEEVFGLFTLAVLNEAGEQRGTVRVLKFAIR